MQHAMEDIRQLDFIRQLSEVTGTVVMPYTRNKMRLLWACILLSAPAILSYGCSSKPKSDSIRITTVTIGGYKELNDFFQMALVQ